MALTNAQEPAGPFIQESYKSVQNKLITASRAAAGSRAAVRYLLTGT
jgi:hypothetical protein